MIGEYGGPWVRETHTTLYKDNLNKGLGRYIVDHLAPKNILEFGSGVCNLINFIAECAPLEESYCIEPQIAVPVARNLKLLNIDIFAGPMPKVLDRRFDLVLSIEVAEHIPREKHEALFDFLVARAGRWIVFSGARPGQGGHGHVAERPELEWREEFTNRGCTFDAKMSALARTFCDARNINHRKNVQVFRAPERSPGLEALEARARPYLADILSIVQASSRAMTGNLFYVDLNGARSGLPEHSLHWKRENLFALGGSARNILEAGFAAGHSALLFLLANPLAKLTIIDPLELAYARPCFDYLNAMFPGRMTLLPGYSHEVLPTLGEKQFDLVHLDGGKERTIDSDLAALRPLVSPDHALVIDDTQNQKLESVVSSWEANGDLETAAFQETNASASRTRWTHRIARYARTDADNAAIIRQMQRIYAESEHKSIYTQVDAKGEIKGKARADGLIAAIRDVENKGLQGAFVEVGVAAGHSSVIAALAASRYLPRDFYLYDTFKGFLPDLPDERDLKDISIRDYDLSKYTGQECDRSTVWKRMLQTGVEAGRLVLIEGPAEESVTRLQPPAISILRLDADLFEPTYAALSFLYDRIEPGGYLIVDDYGHWKGCKKAVDQFFAERGTEFQATPLDYTCWIARR